MDTLRNSVLLDICTSLSLAVVYTLTVVVLCAVRQGLISFWLCVVGVTLDHGAIVGADEAQPLCGLGLEHPPKLTHRSLGPQCSSAEPRE